MHVLYIHQNFPAQFGHIAAYLHKMHGWRCTFVSEQPSGTVDGIEKVQYKIKSGATMQTHFCSRTFENAIWHSHAVYEALKARPAIRPDLIVGHSGFGSTIFLPELYPQVPIVNLFEFYYHPHGLDSDMDFRPDLGWELEDIKYLRARARNAMLLLDLQNCRAGYTPTQFQRSRFPAEYQAKLEVIFDGVERGVYHGYEEKLRPAPGNRPARKIGGVDVPAEAKLVTYCSRGFESMRGFDKFMEAAAIITAQEPSALVLVVGSDKVAYGGDLNYTGGKSFKDWVLSRGKFDLSRIRFLGQVPPQELARLLAATDVHIYLTAPFVLSWSMMNALSCGAVVVGSRTTPVMEMIEDGKTGLLADFFDPADIAAKALAVLRDIPGHRALGRNAEQMIREKFSLEAVLPRMLKLYEKALSSNATAK
jgi:glycosyltransferase involved in cell wall biosynthesis